MVRKWGSSAEGSSTLSSRTEEESSLVACTATQRKRLKKPPTASRDIRTALAVTGVHELMCGRPHCVGAFASRCVGASSCSALTARTAALLFWSEEYSQQSSQRTCPSRTICTTGST